MNNKPSKNMNSEYLFVKYAKLTIQRMKSIGFGH